MSTLFQKYEQQIELLENKNLIFDTNIQDKIKRARLLFKQYRDGDDTTSAELISLINFNNFNTPKYANKIEEDVGEGKVSKVPRSILNDVNRNKARFANIDEFVIADDGGTHVIVDTKILLGISQILSRSQSSK